MSVVVSFGTPAPAVAGRLSREREPDRSQRASPPPDRDELLEIIGAGEGTALELREDPGREGEERRTAADLAEVFVSMANTNGGLVVFGVRPEAREILGVEPERREAAERFALHVAAAYCSPIVPAETDWVGLPGEGGGERACLAVRIPPSFCEVHRANDGRYFRRHDTRRSEQVLTLPNDPPTPIELRPALRSRLEALDRSRLAAYFRRRFPDRSPPEDWSPLLEDHRFAVETPLGVRPTVLGVLMFAERPDAFVPGAFLEISSPRADDPTGKPEVVERITGPLPQQIERAISFLEASPLTRTASAPGEGAHPDSPAYATRALQEAVVNAVLHRDYADPAPAAIRLFPDRLEFENPGALAHASPANLYAGMTPWRRNQLLAGVLACYESRLTGGPLTGAPGGGFLMIVRACERLSGGSPNLELNGGVTRLAIDVAETSISGNPQSVLA